MSNQREAAQVNTICQYTVSVKVKARVTEEIPPGLVMSSHLRSGAAVSV